MRILYDGIEALGQDVEPERELLPLMEKGAELCLREAGIDPEQAEISLTFVSKEEIRELNGRYRNVDNPTDVLSFPLLEDLCQDAGNWQKQPCEFLLGDVVICPEKAFEQAAEYGHSRRRELIYLFVHSVLHLLGCDHMEEEEKREMRRREEEIMRLLELER